MEGIHLERGRVGGRNTREGRMSQCSVGGCGAKCSEIPPPHHYPFTRNIKTQEMSMSSFQRLH